MSKNRIIILLTLPFLLFSLLAASWHVLHGDINFNTDIARDFLLFEDIFYNRNITLIGPRSGGISGVFHGPLWLYMNLPFYVLGQGNPVFVGWFWVLLFIVSVALVFWVAYKLFDLPTGLLSALLFSSVAASYTHAIFNPYGAVLLFPLFFYYFYRYIGEQKPQDLLISMFTLGCIIQFQMAFGGPILVLILPILAYLIIKYKKYKHLLLSLIILIPLSSFLLFDLRHDFLQTKSVINYLSGVENTGKVDIPMGQFLLERIGSMFEGSLGMITFNKWNLTFGVLLLLIGAMMHRTFKKDRTKYVLFYYLFVGFWIITLPYKGVMWGYYYWPFVGMLAIIFSSIWKRVPKILFAAVFILIYISNNQIVWASTFANTFHSEDESLWGFYRRAAQEVYTDAPAEFGYYIYTNDQFGYSTRYAMNQAQRTYTDKKAQPFQKKEITYLMIQDSGDNKLTNNKDWKKYDIKIEKKPIKKTTLNTRYVIEKYQLTDEEQKVEANPNLIQNLIFR